MNYYEILEIHPQASQSEIKAAYYRLSKELHPDKLPSNTPPMAKKIIEDKFKEITEAYSCLIDIEQRRNYDLSLQYSDTSPSFTANAYPYGSVVKDIEYYRGQVERDMEKLIREQARKREQINEQMRQDYERIKQKRREKEAKDKLIREQVERDGRRLQKQEEAKQARLRKEMQRDYENIQKKEEDKRKRIQDEMQRDYERLSQPIKQHNLNRENNLRVTTSTTYINHSNYSVSNVGLGFVGAGTLAGIGTYSTIGSMGLVGGFGGIGLGLGTMTGTGAILGTATYGAFTAIKESDPVALGAIGLGTVGGLGISATVGGMGLSVGGTAFGIGMGTMAFAGGIVGLGIYGLSKMFTNNKQARMYRTLDYLETITREYEEEMKWRELESEDLGIEAELEALKASLGLNN